MSHRPLLVRPALRRAPLARARAAACALALPLAAACGDATGPSAERLVAPSLDRPESVASLPDVVRAGEPFTVRLTTAGEACDEAAPARVTARGQAITVEPMVTRRTACADPRPNRALVWEATVTLPAAGGGQVAFRGADGEWVYGLIAVP